MPSMTHYNTIMAQPKPDMTLFCTNIKLKQIETYLSVNIRLHIKTFPLLVVTLCDTQRHIKIKRKTNGKNHSKPYKYWLHWHFYTH